MEENMATYHWKYKKTVRAWVIAFTVVVLSAISASALLNPSAVYCRALGYDYYTAQSRRGLLGVCELPNGRQVNAWSFYRGKVALEFSYCAQQGYEAKRDESGAICHDCLVCVMPDGEEIRAIELMGLSFQESKCGDGHCGTVEDYNNCPGDCPSGGQDELCDGVADSRCDPDCVMQGESDPDCPGLFVDVKPGSCPNPLNRKDIGVLPVALLGSAMLNVTDIDPASIRLSIEGGTGSLAPIRWHVEDVGTPNPAQGCGECWTVPGDRRPDLVLMFESKAVSMLIGPAFLSEQTLPLKITATLKNGAVVEGKDCVTEVPPRR
jgi:putative hemolysin